MSRRRIVIAVIAAIVLFGGPWLLVVVLDDSAQGASEERVTTGNGSDTTTTSTEGAVSSTTEAPTTTVAPSTTTSASTTTRPPAPSTTAPPTTVPPPAFRSSIGPVSQAELGSSWKPGMGCPDPSQLRMLHLSHWGYDGQVHTGRLVVAASHAERVVAAFRDVYAARFPIQSMVPIDAYGADDQASMRANNTSGFNCRVVAGTSTLSQHGKGLAIDINPLVNPYVKGGTVDPPEGAPYADRDVQAQGMIRADDAVVRAFARQGWGWGGYWSSGQDYQHFSASGG